MSDLPRDKRHVHTPPAGVRAQTASPIAEVDDEITGAHETVDERFDRRAKRPTDKRIERLEEKHDALSGVVTDTRVLVGKMDGKLDGVLDLMSRADALATREASAAEARANAIILARERQLAARSAFWMATLKVLVPLVTAIGIAFAAWKAAGK